MVTAETDTTRKTVLLIDDSLDLLRGLRFALSKEGYLVEVLSLPALAREVIARVRPDLLVLDVMMPGVDGWNVLRMIRDDPEFSTLPVLMLTAKGSTEAKVAGFDLGADDYLTKPFDIIELKCRVRALLRRAESSLSPQPALHNFTAITGNGEHLLIPAQDVYFIGGVRNYTYLHTYADRFLSRAGLGEMAESAPPEFMRVHRSYVANLCRVSGGRWLPSSVYQITLADETGTQIPVSRKLVGEVQSRMGLK
jgi:DNA-binding response OmpR family regulator